MNTDHLQRIKRKLAEVQKDRRKPLGPSDIQRLLAAYESPDPAVRAEALRRSCPCHVSWDAYAQLRPSALRLRDDPVRRVRSLAEHLEDDARMIQNFEGRLDWVSDRDERISESAERARRVKSRRR